MTRTKALIIVVPFALSMLLLALLPLLLDKEKILQLASAALREQTGATLTVGGDIGLALFPRIGVSLADVSLTMPKEEQPGLQVKDLQIGLQLTPLLSGRVAVDTLSLDGLTSRIAATEQAEKVDTANMTDQQLDAYYARRRQARDEAAASAGAALAVPLALDVQTLRLTNSRLELADAGGGAPTVIEIQRFEASDLNLEGRPIRLAGHVTLPAEQAIDLEFNAALRLDQPRQVVLVDQLELEISGATANTISVQASGEATIEGQGADLQLALATAAMHGEGHLRYASLESPRIDADLHFNLFDPALLALAGPEAAAAPGSAPAAADDPLPLAALRDIDTRARLAIDQATLAGHTLQDLRLDLRALDGVIRVDTLTAAVHGGQLTLTGTFDGQHNTATLTTSGQVTGLDVASALAAAEAQPALTGRASLDWQLASEGRTSGELRDALNGPIKLTTTQLVLQEVAIERLLCQAVALTNKETLTASFPANTAFKTLAADIQLADGKAMLRPLRAELPGIALTGTGAYELLGKDFKATFKARLSPELEALDRACRVSKRLTAIDWPVDCKGNVDGEPGKWCQVDTEALVEDLTKNEVQRTIEKKAGKLLDKLFN